VKQIRFFLILSFSAVAQIAIAQGINRLDVRVSEGEEAFTFPFVGGLLAPQFSNIDFNFDGLDDLLVFDRAGGVIMPFILQADGSYSYAPQYISAFPPANSWMLLKDYNDDGISDIFMAPTVQGIAGIEVHQGRNESGSISFQLASESVDGFNVLFVPLGDGVTQVYNSLIDIPGIEDVDGDGDIDIVAFEPGGSTISYYENHSVNNGAGSPGLDFVIEDNCFGKVVESGFSEDLFISEDGEKCGQNLHSGVTEIRHAGSTVTLFDANGDGLQEALIGDISSDGLVLLTNGGTPENAWYNEVDLDFPSSDTPVRINIFNAAYPVTTPGGSLTNMVVAPNEAVGLQSINHVWLYENEGTESVPDYRLKNKNFIIEDMLHFGKNTVPCFMDVNADGLMDIIVGSTGRLEVVGQKSPRLALLLNIGSLEVPEFRLMDRDYLDMSAFATTSGELAPAAGDVDSDGDIDLLVGDDRGLFYFIENIAGPGKSPIFSSPVYNFQELTLGQYVKAAIYDFNQDGLQDLIIGERNFNSAGDVIGSINYIPNTGEAGSPIFSLSTGESSEVFGEVNTKEPGFIRNFAAPYAVKSEGETILFVGSESGQIKVYVDIDDNLNGAFTQLSKSYGKIKEGINSAPALYDINNDGFYDILIGNRRGGLSLYSTSFKSQIKSNTTEIFTQYYQVQPTITNQYFSITGGSGDSAAASLFNEAGQEVMNFTVSSGELIDVSSLSSGIYFIRILSRTNRETHKISIIK